MKTMQTGLHSMAQRVVNAHNTLVDNIMNLGKLTKADAEVVAAKYIKLKVVKLDAVSGVYNVKNGAYFDADVLAKAVTYGD